MNDVLFLFYCFVLIHSSFFLNKKKIKDRRLDLDGITALANKSYDGDSNRVETTRRIASACLDVTDEERCEAAFKILTCMHKDAESRGISKDDF